MDEPEWQTRKQSIDTKLCSLNLAWQIRRAQADAEQMQLLSLVREPLVKNLSMDEVDCDLTPLRGMRGGKAMAKKVFGDLPRMAELNEAVVA